MKTNMQDTSLLAYTDKVLPTLTRKQQAIITFFQFHISKDYTNAELAEAIGWPINCVTPRTLELRTKGLLVMASRRVCKVTGNLAYSWRLMPNR